jgi:thioredoxin:protein disulfide reductase
MNQLWSSSRSRALASAALIAFFAAAAARADDEFLPAQQAYEYQTQADTRAVVVHYNIRSGYYLYRKRLSFATDTPGVTLGEAEFPKGLPHTDAYFGTQEIYRGAIAIRVPYSRAGATPTALNLTLKLQGCADAGLCYPPQAWNTQVALPVASGGTGAPAAGGALLGKLTGVANPAGDFLAPEQAFRFSAEPAGDNAFRLRWVIADGYYLYKSRIKVSAESAFAQLGAVQLPQGLPHTDDYFGEQQVYRQQLEALVPFARATAAAGSVALKVVYQGCADAGLCYPPQTQLMDLSVPAASAGGAGGAAGGGAGGGATGTTVSQQDWMAGLIASGNVFAMIAVFLAAGIGLAFTPCVLPMVPILSGIIAGDGAKITPMRGFALSLAYVLGMSVTYTIAGAVSALAGKQAQAFFQATWILVLFAALFVALALAMFGVFELQMPSALQTRFAGASNRVQGGKFVSTAVMGALSSLVVTACVAPPLFAALAVIGKAGNVARGALALFALSLGMGTPLLIVGASAGKLLPKAGPWMETVKAVFGVVFLGVAAWMLDRVLPPRIMMLLWAGVAFAGVWVLLSVGLRGGRRTRARWAAGGVFALYGALLVGAAAVGGTDPLRPLAGTGLFGASQAVAALPFRPVHSSAELDQQLAAASRAGKRVLLDFSAEWCVSCKEMDTQTFRAPTVRADLLDYVLLKADVTENSANDQALLKRFGIFGPPTTAFFAADGRERPEFRLVGFTAEEPFRAHLRRFEQAL